MSPVELEVFLTKLAWWLHNHSNEEKFVAVYQRPVEPGDPWVAEKYALVPNFPVWWCSLDTAHRMRLVEVVLERYK